MHLEYADILKLIRASEASMLTPEQSHYEPCAFADLAEVRRFCSGEAHAREFEDECTIC